MARVKKAQPSLDALLFSTPEQKILRILLSESTTTLTPRMISSKLKGVRGMGGTDGIMARLNELEDLGLVDFVDNERAVRLRDEVVCVRLLKRLCALCDLESLRNILEPLSSKGILFGSRATGRARSDSDYDLFVVTDSPAATHEAVARHPMAKKIELVAWTTDQYAKIALEDPKLEHKLAGGIVMWGAEW